jgi:hypothetical protein
MRRDKKIILFQEEQLIWARQLSEAMAARDELRFAHPNSALVQLADAKIKRMLRTEGNLPSIWLE